MDKFIVSARKYRPATFESVVGQKHITSTLVNAISRNQLAHAYLFCGPRGVGKTTCARIFAKAINCQTPSADGACNECESCRSFNDGRSFNIHELDAASNNSVDDIRSLTDQVRIPPQIGKYSVYIIDEVHMLSAQAFNAFLKTLEEPPAHAVFILATTEKHKIIPTILSRCQIYDFNRIRVEDGVQYLKYIASQESIVFDDESLHLIAQKADGGMRDALSMFDKAVSFCGTSLNFKEVAKTLNVLDYDTYFSIVENIMQGNYPSVLTMFDEVLRSGFSGQTFITGLNSHFRDLLMCKSPQTMPLLEITGTLLDKYCQQSQVVETSFLFECIALLTSVDGALRTASNQRLNIELALMKLCGLGQKKNDIPQPLPELTKPVINKQASTTPPVSHKTAVKQEEKVTPNISTAKKEEVIPVTETEAVPESQHISSTNISENIQPEAQSSVSEPESINNTVTEEIKSDKSESIAVQGNSVEKEDVPSHMNMEIREQQSPKVSKPSTATASKPTISGTSIADLLVKPQVDYSQSDTGKNKEDNEPQLTVDPQAAEKALAVKEKFISALSAERPRIAVAFNSMRAEGNVISLDVPSEALYEDIMRNRTEILELLTSIAGIVGVPDLQVKVVETQTAAKPIKIEDRLKFLTEKNPTLSVLRKKLDMDFE